MSAIILECEQGSEEWHAARLGIPTASNFDQIVTPSGKLSSSREKYMCKLLADWALGYDTDTFAGTRWTDRGIELEPQAIEYYEFLRGVTPRRVGFVYRDSLRLVGCSPDWLIGDDGAGEVKCPSAAVHIGYLRAAGLPDKYRPQVQGQLWVTGRKWVDFVSYYPGLPEVCVRIEADHEYQAALTDALEVFIAEMRDARSWLMDRHGVNAPVCSQCRRKVSVNDDGWCSLCVDKALSEAS